MAPHATEDNPSEAPPNQDDLRTAISTPSTESDNTASIDDLDLHTFHNFPEPASPAPAPRDIVPAPTRYPETLGSLIEIRESEGKGLGMFAMQDIPRGTILLSEVPMFVLNHDDEIHSIFNSLDLEKQTLFLSLASNIDDDTSKPEAEKSEQESSTQQQKKLNTILSCNAFSIAASKSGIFSTASRINHSHAPNSQYRFRDSIGRMVIWNRWKLMEGEEVSIDYGHGRRSLKRVYGFECDCGVCGVDESDGETDVEIVM